MYKFLLGGLVCLASLATTATPARAGGSAFGCCVGSAYGCGLFKCCRCCCKCCCCVTCCGVQPNAFSPYCFSCGPCCNAPTCFANCGAPPCGPACGPVCAPACGPVCAPACPPVCPSTCTAPIMGGPAAQVQAVAYVPVYQNYFSYGAIQPVAAYNMPVAGR